MRNFFLKLNHAGYFEGLRAQSNKHYRFVNGDAWAGTTHGVVNLEKKLPTFKCQKYMT